MRDRPELTARRDRWGPPAQQGLQWQGTRNSGTAYALNDAVSYNGTSYISIGTGQGHQPDISPTSWNVLAGQGAAGATGAAGVAGATGATGVVGSAGAAGATGATGSIGATGATGLQWQGQWNATTAYELNDAVSYNGTSYISIGTGQGNQPDSSSAFWSVLAGQGAVGATGAPGVAGATGATGVAGSAGAAGATGATGSAGATGATGLQWQWTLNLSTSYSLNDAVSYNGTSYISIGTGPGHQPDISPASWSVLAGQGAAGATGAPGVAGATGATGAVGSAGAAGSIGATGATGLQWQGTWNSTKVYALNDAVSYNGTSYISIGTGQGNQPDSSSAFWSVLAGQGAVGATGAAGVAGATGATGVAGSAGAAGATGATGSAWATGATALQRQGTWNSTKVYALNDAVSYNGTSYISIGTGQGNQPDISSTFWSVLAGQGAVGATGAAGVAGATGATGVAGSAGAAGANGATGSAGATGATGLQWQGTGTQRRCMR